LEACVGNLSGSAALILLFYKYTLALPQLFIYLSRFFNTNGHFFLTSYNTPHPFPVEIFAASLDVYMNTLVRLNGKKSAINNCALVHCFDNFFTDMLTSPFHYLLFGECFIQHSRIFSLPLKSKSSN
jgi:hypothetical protein